MDVQNRFDNLEDDVYRDLQLERRVSWADVPDVGRVRVVESGHGKPVLFVHGGGGIGAMFAPLTAHLRGIRAIVPDRPGFGLSAQLDHRTIGLRRLAVDTLSRVLDRQGVDRATIAGTSMGGLWSLWLAIDCPERVEGLVTLACPALVLGTSAPLPMRLMSKPAIGRRMLRSTPDGRAGAERILGMLGESRETISRLSPEFLELNAIGNALPGYEVSWLSLLSRAVQLRGARSQWALDEAELRRIRVPILAVWGGRDPFGSLAVGRKFARLTGARLVELPSAGHLPWLDSPGLIGAAISTFVADEIGAMSAAGA